MSKRRFSKNCGIFFSLFMLLQGVGFPNKDICHTTQIEFSRSNNESGRAYCELISLSVLRETAVIQENSKVGLDGKDVSSKARSFEVDTCPVERLPFASYPVIPLYILEASLLI